MRLPAQEAQSSWVVGKRRVQFGMRLFVRWLLTELGACDRRSPRRSQIRLCAGALLLPIAVANLTACGAGDLVSLRRDLATAFAAPNVSVSVFDGTTMTVLFESAPQRELPPDQQGEFCRKVASFVRDHYRGYEQLERVHIGFVVRQAQGARQVTKRELACAFATADLGPPPTDSQPTQPSRLQE